MAKEKVAPQIPTPVNLLWENILMIPIFGVIDSKRAQDIEEGVEITIKEKPDLVIMDRQLPDIDGLEAARRIRESEADGKLPIVALTSHAMVGDREKALAARCTGYIEKPINPDTFMAEIKKYLPAQLPKK